MQEVPPAQLKELVLGGVLAVHPQHIRDLFLPKFFKTSGVQTEYVAQNL